MPKPGVVMFLDGEDRTFDHVDPHEGYVYVQDHSEGVSEYIPWHAVEWVGRDLEDTDL